MPQSESLRRRVAQHQPKNKASNEDDKHIYAAMQDVIGYLSARFDLENAFPDCTLAFDKALRVEDMVAHIRRRGMRREFDTAYLDRSIVLRMGAFSFWCGSGKAARWRNSPFCSRKPSARGPTTSGGKRGKKRSRQETPSNAWERI